MTLPTAAALGSSVPLVLACLAPGMSLAAPAGLPDYPWVDNSTFSVDAAGIDAAASAYCASEPAPDAVDFYLGALPQAALDALCLDPAGDPETLLGDLYISGYFGGVWLRDALAGAPARLPGSPPLSPGALRGAALDHAVIRALAAAAGMAVDRAQTGGQTEVLLAARAALPGLLYLYGYNLGYLQVLLAHPPAGVPEQSGALSCGAGLLDCSSDGLDLQIFEAYSGALSSLEAPPDARWRRVVSLVEEVGEPAVASGAAVWEDILADGDVAAAAYVPLVDVSVGFLMATDAAALAAATAWGDGDPAAGRCALLLEAGLEVWSGSYFMGLASDAPAGTFPELSCR